MVKKKYDLFSILLYVLAGLLVLYTVWAAIRSHKYLADMIAQNQLKVSGNEYEIVNFYMTNCAQYVVFAVILAALGWMLQRNSRGYSDNAALRSASGNQAAASPTEKTGDDEADGDDFEEWFRNNDK